MANGKSISLRGPDRVTLVTMLYTQSAGDGSCTAGRSVVRGGRPVDDADLVKILGVPSTRWGASLSLEQAEKVLADATAHLISQGFVVTPNSPAVARRYSQAKTSPGMGG